MLGFPLNCARRHERFGGSRHDDVEVDRSVKRLDCRQCDRSAFVQTHRDGDAFRDQHRGHLITYTGRIVQPSILAGQEVTFHLIALRGQIH